MTPGESVAQLDIAPVSPMPAVLISGFQGEDVLAIQVNALDSLGQSIGTFDEPVTLRITLNPPGGINGNLARVFEVDEQGDTQELPTGVTVNSDGSITVTAYPTNLATFVVAAPGNGMLVPAIYIPFVPNGVGPAVTPSDRRLASW